MRTSLVVIALVACLCAPLTWAQDAAGTGTAGGDTAGSASAGASSGSEDDFFGSSQVEAPKGTAETAGAAAAVESEHVGLSGQLQAMSTYNVARTVLQGTGSLADNTMSNLVGGDFLVDMRLTKGFKAFMDLNVGYVPGGTPTVIDFQTLPGLSPMPLLQYQTTALLIKEVFIDFNIANTVYFRAGKQVLKWGVGYFWQPTDLINIEHETFTNLTALLEGVFGVRADVVFAPWWHLYTFTNLNSVATNDIWDTAFAARSEFLAGSTEFAVSSWVKSGKIPVFGADLSTPLPLDWWAKDGHTLNLTAEGTVSYGDNTARLDPVTGPYAVSNQLVGKVDVGLSRTFDALNVSDRVMVELEFFWNSDGYSQNMLNPATYPVLGANGPVTFLEGGYLQTGYYGQYYGAAFITINDFGTTNMTLTLSGLMNFSDQSGTVLAGWSWSPVNDFTLSVQLGGYLGGVNREYTIGFNPTTFALTPGNQLFGILTATVNF